MGYSEGRSPFHIPDHKVRSDCARNIIEYLVGKAIERSMEISGNYRELSEVLSSLEKSPEAKRLLPAEVFDSLHKASSVESQEKRAEEKSISQSEHNTSSDKSSDSEQETR
jgi:hypothetical protein